MEKANQLREQAQKLLLQADALDGKKPYLLVCQSENYDEPTTTMVYSKTEPTKRQAASAMGFERSAAVEGSGYQISVREFSAHELLRC
jgi:hypothetical protein